MSKKVVLSIIVGMLIVSFAIGSYVCFKINELLKDYEEDARIIQSNYPSISTLDAKRRGALPIAKEHKFNTKNNISSWYESRDDAFDSLGELVSPDETISDSSYPFVIDIGKITNNMKFNYGGGVKFNTTETTDALSGGRVGNLVIQSNYEYVDTCPVWEYDHFYLLGKIGYVESSNIDSTVSAYPSNHWYVILLTPDTKWIFLAAVAQESDYYSLYYDTFVLNNYGDRNTPRTYRLTDN